MKRRATHHMRMIQLRVATIVASVGLVVAGGAHAETRIALVIGNSRYATAPLTNPVNDAALIRDTLKGAGFTVRHVENADRGAMVRSIQTLGRDLAAAGRDSVGLFYFSGHGVQSDGRNYLLPIGGQIDTEADLLPEAVDADWVLKQMEQAGNPLNIVILDACRSNTLAVASKSATKGLARMVAPVGSVVAFATDSGTVAYDGKGRNSPYAAALAKFMAEPGLELKAVLDQVALRVYGETKEQAVPQIPVQLYKLTPTFYFRPGAPVQTAGLSPAAPPVSALSLPATPTPTPAPAPSNEPSSRDCPDCPEMVRIPGGRFVMGDLSGKGYSKPVHEVSIRAFSVGKHEVTFAEWDACVAAGGCSKKPSDRGWGRGNRPVINVSWDDAQQYVKWLSGKTGKRYRLLTESEWEYVARADTTTEYSWGSTASHEDANYGTDECCAGLAAGRDQWVNTSPVGSFRPNQWSLHDLHGNVSEMTQDCWHDFYFGAPTDGSAWTSGGDCPRRVVRGGSWDDVPQAITSAGRGQSTTSYAGSTVGFRLARTD